MTSLQGYTKTVLTDVKKVVFQSVCSSTTMSITLPLFHERHAFQKVAVLPIMVYNARSLKGLKTYISLKAIREAFKELEHYLHFKIVGSCKKLPNVTFLWVGLEFCMANQGHFDGTKTGLTDVRKFNFRSVCRNTPMSITFPLFHENHAFQEVSVLPIKVYKARSLNGLYIPTHNWGRSLSHLNGWNIASISKCKLLKKVDRGIFSLGLTLILTVTSSLGVSWKSVITFQLWWKGGSIVSCLVASIVDRYVCRMDH